MNPIFVIVVILIILSLISKNKSIATVDDWIGKKLKAKKDTNAFFVRMDEKELWIADFSKIARQFKKDEVIGYASGAFYYEGKQSFIVIEIPFLYNTALFICIPESDLEPIP